MANLSKFSEKISDNLEKIKLERMNGASLDDIAKMLGVTRQTVHRWKEKYPEFGQALDEGTAELYAKVELTASHSLIDKLVDRMVTVEQIIEDGVIVREKRKLILADTNAIIFALKSRNPDKWDPITLAKLEKEDNEDVNNKIVDLLSKYK